MKTLNYLLVLCLIFSCTTTPDVTTEISPTCSSDCNQTQGSSFKETKEFKLDGESRFCIDGVFDAQVACYDVQYDFVNGEPFQANNTINKIEFCGFNPESNVIYTLRVHYFEYDFGATDDGPQGYYCIDEILNEEIKDPLCSVECDPNNNSEFKETVEIKIDGKVHECYGFTGAPIDCYEVQYHPSTTEPFQPNNTINVNDFCNFNPEPNIIYTVRAHYFTYNEPGTDDAPQGYYCIGEILDEEIKEPSCSSECDSNDESEYQETVLIKIDGMTQVCYFGFSGAPTDCYNVQFNPTPNEPYDPNSTIYSNDICGFYPEYDVIYLVRAHYFAYTNPGIDDAPQGYYCIDEILEEQDNPISCIDNCTTIVDVDEYVSTVEFWIDGMSRECLGEFAVLTCYATKPNDFELDLGPDYWNDRIYTSELSCGFDLVDDQTKKYLIRAHKFERTEYVPDMPSIYYYCVEEVLSIENRY